MSTGVGTVQVGWLQTRHLREEEEEEERYREVQGVKSFSRRRRSARPLPVLQLSRHSFGDAATQQPHQEEDAHAQSDHEQDVVLRRRQHHLHGQV